MDPCMITLIRACQHVRIFHNYNKEKNWIKIPDAIMIEKPIWLSVNSSSKTRTCTLACVFHIYVFWT